MQKQVIDRRLKAKHYEQVNLINKNLRFIKLVKIEKGTSEHYSPKKRNVRPTLKMGRYAPTVVGASYAPNYIPSIPKRNLFTETKNNSMENNIYEMSNADLLRSVKASEDNVQIGKHASVSSTSNDSGTNDRSSDDTSPKQSTLDDQMTQEQIENLLELDDSDDHNNS